ncbi:hypothetical protein CB1_000740056 [Camelus ferus]|nr:hypothetical protein CB1_000740056 [Camelus ferus]
MLMGFSWRSLNSQEVCRRQLDQGGITANRGGRDFPSGRAGAECQQVRFSKELPKPGPGPSGPPPRALVKSPLGQVLKLFQVHKEQV